MKNLGLALLLSIACVIQAYGQEVEISFWYGKKQTFGQLGLPQKQINILGNIHSDQKYMKVYYQLNNQKQNPLTLGSDLHRLCGEGDFNIDIPYTDLEKGKNEVKVLVTQNGNTLKEDIVKVIVHKEKQWPLPYQIKWKEVKNIQDVAQVVDGHWKITENGVRNKDVYYDRLLIFGDSTWTDYEVKTSVTFHGYNPPVPGPPTYNVSHFAIATRWPGHDVDEFQPHRKWFPLGATSEFRITDNYDSCRWRIFDGEYFYGEQGRKKHRTIIPETLYHVIHRVESLSENQTLYSVKLWLASEEEPKDWDFQTIKNNATNQSGSACIIAHHTEVTFGDVEVVPVGKKEN